MVQTGCTKKAGYVGMKVGYGTVALTPLGRLWNAGCTSLVGYGTQVALTPLGRLWNAGCTSLVGYGTQVALTPLGRLWNAGCTSLNTGCTNATR